ncbi:MAG: TRL-like protein family [Lentisphaerae bacterium]|nr:TRL-like protein family [Lentisphaerota bacterium]MCP4101630.1 TRL-like protein family [Lentisphaerota bacterium]
MKKFSLLAAVSAFLILAGTGCTTPQPIGFIYTDCKTPKLVTNLDSKKPLKVGRAMSESYFCVVAVGDSSIEKAMKNGKIKKVHYVDRKMKNVLGITKYETIVYGE